MDYICGGSWDLAGTSYNWAYNPTPKSIGAPAGPNPTGFREAIVIAPAPIIQPPKPSHVRELTCWGRYLLHLGVFKIGETDYTPALFKAVPQLRGYVHMGSLLNSLYCYYGSLLGQLPYTDGPYRWYKFIALGFVYMGISRNSL